MADLTDTQLVFLIDNIMSTEFVSSALRRDMLAAFVEIQAIRAAATRLEELALSCEHNHRVEIRDIGREIRERMRED